MNIETSKVSDDGSSVSFGLGTWAGTVLYGMYVDGMVYLPKN